MHNSYPEYGSTYLSAPQASVLRASDRTVDKNETIQTSPEHINISKVSQTN